MVIVVNKKGYTLIELLIVMIIFGIITAIFVGTTSYAFKDNTDEYYKIRINNIESNAKRYAMTLEELKTEDSKIITVKDLVNAGYISSDNKDGDVIDPRNSNATLNNMKIKLTYDEAKGYKATVIEEK